MQYIISVFESFLAALSTFEFKDAVDIICITLIIFAVVRYVRETKAEQLLKGVVILLVIYFASVIFDLRMLTSLLKSLFDYAVIILFIIFQPEIRKALERIGRSKFSKSFIFSSQESFEPLQNAQKKIIQDVSDAAVVFSRSKVGALIVFERKSNLGDVINTGTIINAESSVAVIGNLFFNKAPLHDGAMVIRNGRIYAAGCILPLTKNEDIDINLGTRHRAGIGMSEESDAVVLIVSEETGHISLSVKGNLTRMYNREELVNRLEQLILPSDTKTDIVDLIPIFSSRRKEKKDGK